MKLKLNMYVRHPGSNFTKTKFTILKIYYTSRNAYLHVDGGLERRSGKGRTRPVPAVVGGVRERALLTDALNVRIHGGNL